MGRGIRVCGLWPWENTLILQLAMIFVKDMGRMTAFYRDTLGLSVVPGRSVPGWTVLDAGGIHLALHQIPDAIAQGIEIGDPPEARENTPIKLVFQTSDMEGVCARLRAAGARVFEPRGSGSRDALDPEGNVFQIKPA